MRSIGEGITLNHPMLRFPDVRARIHSRASQTEDRDRDDKVILPFHRDQTPTFRDTKNRKSRHRHTVAGLDSGCSLPTIGVMLGLDDGSSGES